MVSSDEEDNLENDRDCPANRHGYDDDDDDDDDSDYVSKFYISWGRRKFQKLGL